MPLFKGATSKIILSYLPSRDLRRLYAVHQSEIAEAGLGEDWEIFRKTMTKVRKLGHVISHGEVDPERIGIAVPILDDRSRILGSLSYVIAASEERAVARLVSLAAAAAREIEAGMQADFGTRIAA